MSHTWKHREEQRFDAKHPELAKRMKKDPTGERRILMGGEGPSSAEELEAMYEKMPKSDKYIRKPKMRPEEYKEIGEKYAKEHERTKNKRLRELEKKLKDKKF